MVLLEESAIRQCSRVTALSPSSLGTFGAGSDSFSLTEMKSMVAPGQHFMRKKRFA